jgi:polysaccharide export outer membrane protein
MKKNIYLNYILIILVLFGFSSCVQQKQIAYFQKALNEADTIAVAKAYVPRIQAGDILSIYIGSLNPAASSFFNPYSTAPLNTEATNQANGFNGATEAPSSMLTQNAAPSFLVDSAGMIELPLIGTIKLAGLTTSQARDTIKSHLKKLLKEPTVNVRFLNYRISIMGEVLHPSVYIIPNETITITEALSLAGDMTIYGKRDNVLVIRSVDGKKVVGTVNMNNRNIFNSPFYYLHANDIVYVQPGKGRIAETDKIYQILPTLLSALSFISIIFVYSKK